MVGLFLIECFFENLFIIEVDDCSLLCWLVGGEISVGVMDMVGVIFLMCIEGIGNVCVVVDVGFVYDLGIGYWCDWFIFGWIL